MNLQWYNDTQMNQDTRHSAQTRERLLNALDRHWNCHAHGPPRRPYIKPSQTYGLELCPSDRGNNSSYYTTARTDKGDRHSHRNCPGDTFTYPETGALRSRGRGTWRAPQKIAPGVGTRSKTRIAELERRDAAQAQAAHARWPPSPDATEGIQELTRELKICNVPRNVHTELQRVLPSVEEEEIVRPPRQPPAAGLMTRHQDTYYIPPPRAVGGARGNSAPVSTATLGLIQRQDPSLAAQLREDPASMMTQATRHKVYSTMRLIRAGMLGQLDSLQQWEEAMRRQDEM